MVLAGAVLASVGVGLVALDGGPEWTTTEPAARSAFEAAIAAEMKLYTGDARANLERAVALDPDFALACAYLSDQLMHQDPPRSEQLLQAALAVDAAQLTPRESFLIRRSQLLRAGRLEEAEAALDGFLEENPRDPFALRIKAEQAWGAGDFEAAEALYLRLLELSPNWVVAYNNLGYLAMLQGLFADAEEYLSSYRFIAPEQANPHDSLGELYVIVGRWPDAVDCFEAAIEVRQDFWDAHAHLVLVRSLQGDFERARELAEEARASGGCPPDMLNTMTCSVDYLEAQLTGDWQALLSKDLRHCMQQSLVGGLVAVTLHRAACSSGELERAVSLEHAIERAADLQGDTRSVADHNLQAFFEQMRAVRLAFGGDLEGASRGLGLADKHLTYAGCVLGVHKIWTRLALVEVLRRDGRDDEARALLSEVRTVNPQLVLAYQSVPLLQEIGGGGQGR
jgi:Flp pilus assembly protein TadD